MADHGLVPLYFTVATWATKNGCIGASTIRFFSVTPRICSGVRLVASTCNAGHPTRSVLSRFAIAAGETRSVGPSGRSQRART